MLKKLYALIFLAVIASIQTVFAQRISLFGVKPDLLLVVVVAWGVGRGVEEGGVVGFISGFMEDILSSGFYLHTFTKTAAGFVAGAIRGSLDVASNLLYAITTAAMTVLIYLLNMVAFYFFFGRALPSVLAIILVIMIASVYNGVLAFLVARPIVSFIERYLVEGDSSVREYKLYRI